MNLVRTLRGTSVNKKKKVSKMKVSNTGKKVSNTENSARKQRFLKSKTKKSPEALKMKNSLNQIKITAGPVTKKPDKQKEECQRWRMGSMEHDLRISAQEVPVANKHDHI